MDIYIELFQIFQAVSFVVGAMVIAGGMFLAGIWVHDVNQIIKERNKK